VEAGFRKYQFGKALETHLSAGSGKYLQGKLWKCIWCGVWKVPSGKALETYLYAGFRKYLQGKALETWLSAGSGKYLQGKLWKHNCLLRNVQSPESTGL
jgi:hypothetical protein